MTDRELLKEAYDVLVKAWIPPHRVALIDRIAAALATPVSTGEDVHGVVAGAFDFRAHLQRQRDWSGRIFGPGPRTLGVIEHIRKELREIEADPSDVTEWIDVVILALDGAWRAGYQPEQIIDALIAKQTKNEGRTWPDWRTASPDRAIEHDRSADAAPPAGDDARDAARYRWLRGATWLVLKTNRIKWVQPDGSEFYSSHFLQANGMQCAAAPTLDETIDAAMRAQGESK